MTLLKTIDGNYFFLIILSYTFLTNISSILFLLTFITVTMPSFYGHE